MSKITKTEVCQGCLSSERRLLSLGAHKKLLYRILGDDSRLARTAINNFLKPHHQLCWECHQMLLNVHKFQQRVLQAQATLNSFRKNKEEKTHALPLSSLTVMMKNNIDYIEIYSGKSDYTIQNDMQEYDDAKNITQIVIENSVEIKLECSDDDCSQNKAENFAVENSQNEIANDVDNFKDTSIEVFKDVRANQDNYDDDTQEESADDDAQVESADDDDQAIDDSSISGESEAEAYFEPPKKVKKVVKRDSEEDDDYEPPQFVKREVENKPKEKTVVPNAKYRQVECKIQNIRTQFKRVPMDRNDLYVFLEKYRNSREYKEAQYKCDKCVQDFLNEDLLKCHLNKHDKAENTPHTCEICETYWSTQDLLDMHYRNQHTFKLECLLCGEQFLRKRLLITHQDDMHNLTVECLECGCKFGDRKSFWRHHRELHSTFSCDNCDSSYRSKSSIIKHFRHHHRVFKCDKCDKQYKSRVKLLYHKKYIHTHDDSEHTYCVECDKRFPNELQMKHHLKHSSKHGGSTRYPCPECDKTFRHKFLQEKHYKFVHLKQFEHPCPICGKCFPTNHRLLNHKRRVHDKVPKVKNKFCQHCGKGFSENSILVKHIRTHTGERPFACEFCPSSFAQKTPMITHTRRVHNKPDYMRPAAETN